MMENKKSYLHKNPGLTLIEVIISVALLAILSVPIFTMVNTNVKLSQKTELRQQATIIGQRILEYLGSIKDVTLGDNDVLSSLGVDIAFEKSIDSDEVIGNGITSDKFKVAIQMKNIIQNVTDETPSLTVNDLMKNPLFVITEQSNYLNINGELMADDLSLMIEHNVVRICDQNLKCVEKPIMNNQVTIYVQGKIANSYKILVENQLSTTMTIYAQYDANQNKNINLVTTDGQVDISYLIKQKDIGLESDESFVGQLGDLYEISVSITSAEVEGNLFKGDTVSHLNICEIGQGGY